MHVDALGEPWQEDELPLRLLGRVEWLHVAPLLRGDFPLEVLERLARGRRLLLDGQGLVRVRRQGPLELHGAFDRDLLRHITVLKLAEEEAHAIVGDDDLEELRALGVPEVVVTFGLRGSLVLTRGIAERLRAHPVDADPTGAGDAFTIAYAGARAGGHGPVSAARRATALVASLLGTRR
jgi:sugar/nucleoside kinase (ribokinase family)